MVYNARFIYRNKQGSKAIFYSYASEESHKTINISQYIAFLDMGYTLYNLDKEAGELVIELPVCHMTDMDNPMVDVEIHGNLISVENICMQLLRQDMFDIEKRETKNNLKAGILADITYGKQNVKTLELDYYEDLQKLITDWCGNKLYKETLKRVLTAESYKWCKLLPSNLVHNEKGFISNTTIFHIKFLDTNITFSNKMQNTLFSETMATNQLLHFAMKLNEAQLSSWVVNKIKEKSNQLIEFKADKNISDKSLISSFINYYRQVAGEDIVGLLMSCKYGIQTDYSLVKDFLHLSDYSASCIKMSADALNRARQTGICFDFSQYDSLLCLREISKHRLMGKLNLHIMLYVNKDLVIQNITIRSLDDNI